MTTNAPQPSQAGIEPITIVFQGEHGSIPLGLRWENVPAFAVITGKNGVGKSQLLEVIASTFGALVPRGRMSMQSPERLTSSIATIEGAEFQNGEVFHSYSAWQLAGGGSANKTSVQQAIREFATWHSPEISPWYAEELGRLAGIESVKEVRALTPEQIEQYVTPALLWGKGLPASRQSLAFLFLAYRLFEQNATKNGKTPDEIRTLYGAEPWTDLNEILAAADLSFRVVEPAVSTSYSLVGDENYTLRIRDIERNCEVPFERLSSGEQVIMSMALWLFGARQVGRHYRLLLLDEPDAHLHPSMTRRFLDVIQKVFVEERGVRVIMTTHSPSTVALVPESSLFEMTRLSEPRIQRAASRTEAIANLTDGFVITHEGMQIVMCEGKNDVPFYQTVWERLTETESNAANKLLSKLPSLVFVPGTGIQTVLGILPQLRDAGLNHFHAIIDRDKDNQPSEGVHVIERRALENYLLDPISVWCLLHNEGKAPPVIGINISRGQRAQVKDRTEVELQAIADSILSPVEKKLTGLGVNETTRETIRFVNGKSLQYPKWLLHGKKEDLLKAFQVVLPRVTSGNRIHEELTTSFAALDMVPEDLLNLFKFIQSSGKTGSH